MLNIRHTATTSDGHLPLHKATIQYYKVCNSAANLLKKNLNSHKTKNNKVNEIHFLISRVYPAQIARFFSQAPVRLSAVFTGVEKNTHCK